jgi:hypothetical protein
MLRFILIASMVGGADCAVVHAQSRTLPSHGKIKLDSYNMLLRDVHPASQAQANYLQNRLFATGLKKAERLERKERLDSYGERQMIKTLQNYSSVATRLASGRPTSGSSLATFWVLVSVFGDRSEVYDALSSTAPPMTHEDFTPTFQFVHILAPSGELEPPPLLLESAAGLDASGIQSAWAAVVEKLHAMGRLSTLEAAHFRDGVADYCQKAKEAIRVRSPASGRLQAKNYLASLRSLADALYRPQQCAQIRHYLDQGGYSFHGDNLLGLMEHMLRNRVTPAHGSTAQLALAEVARPINRVLEQEMAIHFERVDSLAEGEGHRPYAAEYRRHQDPAAAMPGPELSQSIQGGHVPFSTARARMDL